MALTACEAFKVGFLARCAADGLSAAQTLAQVKLAQEKLAFLDSLPLALTQLATGLGSGVKSLAGGALELGVPAALAAPPLVGGLGGLGLAKATDISDEDVDDVKDRETMNAYRTETARLRRQTAWRDYLRRQGPGRRRLS